MGVGIKEVIREGQGRSDFSKGAYTIKRPYEVYISGVRGPLRSATNILQKNGLLG